VGALGAALGTMVANLSSHRRGWDERWETYSDVAERGKAAHAELCALVDLDTQAFNAIMAAWKAEPEERDAAIEAATRQAIEVPLQVMETALASMDVIREMAETGLEASISDVGVAALCARTAVLGAWLNVRINARDLHADEAARDAYLERAEAIRVDALGRETQILEIVEGKLES
jgi:glutamate formiminotransferase/formiminotetrahydrofolate cyclodeaminase